MFFVLLATLLSILYSDSAAAVDTITVAQPISDNETIISSSRAFEMGFFSPGDSSNRYVGIWYNDETRAIIWVANRNKPLVNDSSGLVTISENGNLVVLNGQNEIFWSSNVSNPGSNVTAQLLDSGNLVLQARNNSETLWQSFQQPINAFLRRMSLFTNVKTGEKVQLTSWKSDLDPSRGNFSAGISLLNIPQVFVWKNNVPYWRSGQWNGREFIGISNITTVYLGGFELILNEDAGTASISFEFPIDPTTYFVLDPQGNMNQLAREDGTRRWVNRQRYPENACDVYGRCGQFGICSHRRSPICVCLRGFEPKNLKEWRGENWTSGCIRRRPLKCERVNRTGEEDGFVKYNMVKLPDLAERTPIHEDRCRGFCLSNCSCLGYAYDVGIGCMTWSNNLTDVQQFYSKGSDFFLRLAHSELGKD